MVLTRPQIIYCMLGINELAFRGMIDDCVANSIINNLSLELLKECEEFSDALIEKIEKDNSKNLHEDSLKRDPKSGWPIND